MSVNKKLVTSYAKSLFQNIVNNFNKNKVEISSGDSFEISQITSSEPKKITPTIIGVGEELLVLRSILISSNKLNSVFKNPTYSEQQKLKIILSLFSNISQTTKSFLRVLTERSHLSLIPEISEEYNSFILKYKNATIVKLVTACPLDDITGSNLFKTLKKITNSEEIVLYSSYNRKLLGGLILEYNSVSIDASILKEFSLFFNEA